MESAFKIDMKEILTSKKAFREGVRKALLTTDFSTNAATVPPEQAQEWLTLLRGQSVFIEQHATEVSVGSNLSGELPRQHFGEPITRAGAEIETTTETTAGPEYDKLSYTAKKLKVRRHISMDALFTAAIGADSLEEALLNGIKSRAAIDLELLGFNGDETAYAAINTPRGYLLRANNGWFNQAQRARVLNANGAVLSTNLLYEALDEFPEESWTDNVRWIGSRGLKRDFTRLAAAKTGGDVLADVYFAKTNMAIDYNVIEAAFISVPAIPTNDDLVVTGASVAMGQSTTRGPWQIVTGSNDKMLLTVTTGGAPLAQVNITLTAGLRYPSDIAQDINTAMAAASAAHSAAVNARDWRGALLIATSATGATESIAFDAVANSVYLTLTPAGSGGGIVSGATVSGAASGGTVYEGSGILLTDPANLIWVSSTEMRSSWEWDDETDHMRFVLYYYADFVIEDPQACVYIQNVRKQRSL